MTRSCLVSTVFHEPPPIAIVPGHIMYKQLDSWRVGSLEMRLLFINWICSLLGLVIIMYTATVPCIIMFDHLAKITFCMTHAILRSQQLVLYYPVGFKHFLQYWCCLLQKPSCVIDTMSSISSCNSHVYNTHLPYYKYLQCYFLRCIVLSLGAPDH